MLPGWFGFGTGISAVVKRYGETALTDMLKGWFFARGLVADVEMVLAKADLNIAETTPSSQVRCTPNSSRSYARSSS